MILGVCKLLETYLIMIQNMQVKFEKSLKKQNILFSTGYLPFRPGLVYGDRGTENWLKNGSKTGATY